MNNDYHISACAVPDEHCECGNSAQCTLSLSLSVAFAHHIEPGPFRVDLAVSPLREAETKL